MNKFQRAEDLETESSVSDTTPIIMIYDLYSII